MKWNDSFLGSLLSAMAGRNVAESHRAKKCDARYSRRRPNYHLHSNAAAHRLAEDARFAADAARQATMDAVRATADTLHATLEHMTIVERMRRSLYDLGDVNPRDSN